MANRKVLKKLWEMLTLYSQPFLQSNQYWKYSDLALRWVQALQADNDFLRFGSMNSLRTKEKGVGWHNSWIYWTGNYCLYLTSRSVRRKMVVSKQFSHKNASESHWFLCVSLIDMYERLWKVELCERTMTIARISDWILIDWLCTFMAHLEWNKTNFKKSENQI